jgi:uncharacterized membrane protein
MTCIVRHPGPGMRCSMYLLLFVLLLTLPSWAAATEPTLIISHYEVSPPVLVPGDAGTITVHLTNTAESATKTESSTFGSTVGSQSTTTTTALTASIESISLKGGGLEVLSGSYQNVGDVGPGQTIPEVWIRLAGARSVKYPIPVNVDTELAVQKQSSLLVTRDLPRTIDPGADFTINVSFENEGLIRAHDITVALNTSTSSIAPTSPGTYYIDKLDPGESTVIRVDFTTDRNAPLGLQPVDLTVRFRNADGSNRTQFERIGVPIQGRAEIGIAAVTTDPPRIRAGDLLDLIIRIENVGTDRARSVMADIDIELDGSKEAFIGTIDPDNDGPAVFLLEADTAGEYQYAMTIRYVDDYGMHTQNETLRLTVAEREGPGVIILAGVLIVIAAAAIFLWMRRRKKS